jgi:hypothetical protein
MFGGHVWGFGPALQHLIPVVAGSSLSLWAL